MTQDASTSTYEQLSALCAQMAAALESLRTNAALLYQNAEGCAVNHYGEDFQIHGLPGWLADCEKSIATAVAALTAYRTMSPDPVWQPAERFKWARFIVQHKPEHFRDHACKICVPEDRVIFPGGEDFVCVYHEAVALLEQSEEGRDILNRARGEG